MGYQSIVHWANDVIVPYYPAIVQCIAEILRFNGFQMVVNLEFFKFNILTGLL